MCAATPVSYTHLDVYKRQLYVRVTAEAKTTASADFSPSIISENTVEIITLPVAGQVTAARDGKLLKGNYEYYDFQNKEEKNSKYEWLEPVSYTHLDVYKRQLLRCTSPAGLFRSISPLRTWVWTARCGR